MAKNRELSPAEAASPSSASASKKRKSQLTEIEVDVSAPEPPSKKARRALKKGKPLPTKPASDDEKPAAEPKEDGADKSKKEKVRSEHSVWVGNLPFTITAAELKQWLIDNSGGVILDESITRMKLPMSKDKSGAKKGDKPANRGFAYVDFDGIGTQMAAIALSETRLGFRNLLIKDAKSFDGRPKKEKENGTTTGDGAAKEEDPNANRKIFVGNLGFQTNEDDIWSHFEKCGEIEWAKVATFEDTGKCKGYGWVKFKEAAGAAWAVKGFVKIKEAIETEEDFHVKEAEENKAEEGVAEQEQKKFKTRKWWVNKLKGRALKIEMAEEDQTRYKKRFGKDAQKKQQMPAKEGESATAGEDYIAEAAKSAMTAEAAAAAA